MKKLKVVSGYVICELSDREMVNRNISSKYVLITKNEMEYVSSLREIEFEADNIQELIDFCA